jgi:cytochrome b pre-mRNA-processing protein 3
LDRWGWLLRALGYEGDESLRGNLSSKIYKVCENQSAKQALYKDMGLEPNFRTKHAMTMLHVWCIHRRLIKEGGEGKLVQEALFDRCWEESTLAIRALGVPELTVNKHLKELQKISFGALVNYDHGMQTGTDELAGALYRNLYAADEEVPEDTVLSMAAYVQRQARAVDKLDLDDFLKGNIVWDNKGLAKGLAEVETEGAESDAIAEATLSEETLSSGVGSMHGDWQEAVDQRGQTYYWNMVTREVVWDLPPDAGPVRSSSSTE